MATACQHRAARDPARREAHAKDLGTRRLGIMGAHYIKDRRAAPPRLPHPGAGKNVAGRYFMVDKVVAALCVRDSEGAKLTTEVFEVPDLVDERCARSSYGPLATGHC